MLSNAPHDIFFMLCGTLGNAPHDVFFICGMLGNAPHNFFNLHGMLGDIPHVVFIHGMLGDAPHDVYIIRGMLGNAPHGALFGFLAFKSYQVYFDLLGLISFAACKSESLKPRQGIELKHLLLVLLVCTVKNDKYRYPNFVRGWRWLCLLQ
jgi:hypothetical protein